MVVDFTDFFDLPVLVIYYLCKGFKFTDILSDVDRSISWVYDTEPEFLENAISTLLYHLIAETFGQHGQPSQFLHHEVDFHSVIVAAGVVGSDIPQDGHPLALDTVLASVFNSARGQSHSFGLIGIGDAVATDKD